MASARIKKKAVYGAVSVLAILHVLLLAWGASRHSPVCDEVSHLPAGISHWQLGTFDLFAVNPPLVRMVAALPVLLAKPNTDWRQYGAAPARQELILGGDFVVANGQRCFWLFTLARWACIPFSLLGGYICFRWARELYGQLAGVLAFALWCFSPNVITHGQMITPDVGATAFGVAAAYVFWHWLKGPTWRSTLSAGVVFGLAQLTRTTWIVLFPLWPVLWVVWRWPQRRDLSRRAWLREGGQLVVILLIGLYLINLGYGFEGSGQKLGDYPFVSRTLGGPEENIDVRLKGLNRFAGTWLGEVPVPVPRNYLAGIDLQKWDFEKKLWSYLRGEWQLGGWWYYYLYALAVKVPLGTWILVVLAFLAGILGLGYGASWRDELVLLAPLVVILTFVSSQTGFNHHLRYVLPIFPFAFIWASKVARAADLRHWKMASMAAAALAWSVGSSLWVYPHSLSYFNELVGGPTGGHAHLDHSNIDWGQDLLYLKRWLGEHPEVRPLGLVYYLPPYVMDPKMVGIEYTRPPPGPRNRYGPPPGKPDELGPQPGWYIISICHMLGAPGEGYSYFRRFQPVDMIGYSMYVYHITVDEANRVRRELGLPKLVAPEQRRPTVERGAVP